MDWQSLLPQVQRLAEEAGEAILQLYRGGDYQHYAKPDATPVTSADYAANDILIRGLQQLTADIPIISEESAHLQLSARHNWPCYWLIDPLDGTQEFVAGSGDFAVSIALISSSWPVFGLVYWPLGQRHYYAIEGQGAWRQTVSAKAQPIRVRPLSDGDDIIMAVSRRQDSSRTLALFYQPEKVRLLPLGSASLKSCYVAEGKADCYLRLGPTGEWDTGACQCIVEEAGGRLLDCEFHALSYNQRETFENPDFMVLGDQSIDWRRIIKPHRSIRNEKN